MPNRKPRQTVRHPGESLAGAASWRAAGLRYYTLGHYYATRFGGRVQKISVDAGFTCPNADGTLAVGGCAFCNNRSFSPSRRGPRRDIASQIRHGMLRLQDRYGCCMFLAYFQPATNTYADVAKLRTVYTQAIQQPGIVGLAIGTRPDCLPDEVLDLLEELARDTYISLELGIQTIHNRSLDWMNRGHRYEIVPEAVGRCRGRGFDIGAHVILGLPGESHDQMLQTAGEMSRLGLDSIKLHNLYAARHTPLAEQVDRGEVRLWDRGEYVSAVVDFLELLPPTTVIERLSGEAPADFLVGPAWCLDKSGTLSAIRDQLQRRDSWQGKHHACAPQGG